MRRWGWLILLMVGGCKADTTIRPDASGACPPGTTHIIGFGPAKEHTGSLCMPTATPTPLQAKVKDGWALPTGCAIAGTLDNYDGNCGWLGGWGCWRDQYDQTWAIRCDMEETDE